MAYKSVLTLGTSAESAKRVFAAAAKFAMAQDGHLDGLAIGVDRTQLGYSYVGAGAVLTQMSQERAEADAKTIEAAMTAAAAEAPENLRWSVESAVTMIGSIADLVAARARFADLVVLQKPYGEQRFIEDEAVVEAALFEAQVPVMILPDALAADGIKGRRVILAWNQSREAMTAARLAMPLLQAAERVTVTVIDPPAHGPDRSDPGGALCQMLVRHGVRAEVSVLALTMPRVSDVLQRHITDLDADLLVMGAYGHSRLREAVLGGATREILEHAKIPVLMAH
jgi:nucleotide-binding universal stress UspA family protein